MLAVVGSHDVVDDEVIYGRNFEVTSEQHGVGPGPDPVVESLQDEHLVVANFRFSDMQGAAIVQAQEVDVPGAAAGPFRGELPLQLVASGPAD